MRARGGVNMGQRFASACIVVLAGAGMAFTARGLTTGATIAYFAMVVVALGKLVVIPSRFSS
jgi:hypothetical protein